MKKRLLFRTFTIMLAAITLLSSTSAYNLLVYANQEIVSATLSANETDETYEPNITVQGGDLQLETNAEGDSEAEDFSWGTDANGIPADGSEQNPYQISSLEHFLQVNTLVNDTTGSSVANVNYKYFTLTADIDISSLRVEDFIKDIGDAYFVSTDHKNPNSQQVYINIDGSYTDANGMTQRHKITGGTNGWNIEIAGHQNFSIFGYLSQNSVVSNIIFENINVNVTTSSSRQIAIIANKNDGLIENCSINNCSVKSNLSSDHENPYYGVDGVSFYNGVAGAVADNGGTIRGLSVNDISIAVAGRDDYIGAVVAQNRGLIDSVAVSGVQISATSFNNYIGGIAGYNYPDDTALGIKNCSVDMAGRSGKVKNFTNGAYVGGLVGSNDGYLYNSSVTGTYSSAQNTTSASYNMLGFVDSNCADITYFGGAAGISTGVISAVTVSNVGFFSHASNSTKQAYFGGITSTVESAGSIENCVASGVFVASNDAQTYAGGVIGFASDTIADGAIQNTYALYKLVNPRMDYVGAVIGWGGNASTLSNCYWSDQLSGSSVAYLQRDVTYKDLVASAEAIAGNLYSANKAVVAPRNSTVTVPASSLIHRWDGTGVEISTPTQDVNVPTNGLANTLAYAPYTVNFTFPDGIGSSDKKEMAVSFNIDVLVTTAQGDPDEINRPMEISSSAQAKYISLVPYGHYKLTSDVSVSTSSWDAPVFTGTLNGNERTITIDGSLFDAVIGARAGDIGNSDSAENQNAKTLSTNPDNDNENYLVNGYVYNLNVDLSENITKSVFGNLINATFVNVSLTDGDVADDDDNEETFDGFYATISAKREATFAAAANGFSYIYGCSSNVSVYVEKDGRGTANNNIALFIAKLSGKVTVDNCYINGNMYINGGINGNSGRAAFIGNIADNRGFILNSAICTKIKFAAGIDTDNCAVVFGETVSANNNRYKNIVWSMNDPDAVFYPVCGEFANLFNKEQIVLWGGSAAAGGNYTYPDKTVAAGNSVNFDITVPQNIKSFASVSASDFSVSLDDASESPLEITSVSVVDGKLKIIAKAKPLAEGETLPSYLYDWVRVYHQPSGLTTFVRIFVKESGLSYNAEDGYYHITSESDLKFISQNINKPDPEGSGTTYREAAYILDADIYMSEPITPIGTAASPFTGVFTGPVDENGNPLYTIYNLTISASSNSDNVALFGGVDSSSEPLVLGTSQTTVQRGISNIALSGARVEGGNNSAVLVAAAIGPTSGNYYGKVNISNIVISDSTVIAGSVNDVNAGKAAAAVLAYAQNVKLNISSIKINDVEVMTHFFPATPRYFMEGSTAGIGGVIGSVSETRTGVDMEESMNVSITDVQIDDISLSSIANSGKTYVMANAGAVVGLFYAKYTADTTKYPTLTIGNPAFSGEGYDVTVNDVVVMTQGVGGGILGAANVRTSINYACVSGSKSPIGIEEEELESLPTRIWGTTELYLGGIAGYVGSIVPETNNNNQQYYYPSLEEVYGSINGCKVENADIRAIVAQGTTLTRNVTAGGIVGAINGHKNSTAVYSSEVASSNIEAIVVGGIVGSCIDTYGRNSAGTGYGYINAPVYSNSINIDSCRVTGSEIRTVDGVTPATEIIDGTAAYGVGGIIGTNRRSFTSYAMHTSVNRCYVDNKTVIANTITPWTDNVEKCIHSATGGLVGSGFENGIENGELSITNNEVYATIIAENSYPADTELPAANISFFKALTATGGLVGSLIGTQYQKYEPENYEVCDLSKVTIQHGIFGGSIKGTDGIGGAVGVISAASAYTSANDLPENLISDIAITGQLESTLTTAVYHGGIVVGHMAVTADGAVNDDDDLYVFDVAAGTDLTDTFNRIYFSSFAIDAVSFPIFGYHNASSATTSSDTPFSTNAGDILINCYEDVNKKDGNKTNQFTDVTTGAVFTLSDSYPLPTRPSGGADAYSVAGQSWYGSNTDIATLNSSGPNDLTVTPKNSGTINVCVNYVGTVGDGTWSREVSLPAGFKFTSTNQAPLDYVVHNGQTYYIISNPYDIVLIGKTPGNTSVISAELMSATYWIVNDVVLEDSLFSENGIYDGGIIPVGTTSIPFSGAITSMPAGEFTTASGTTYVSDGSAKTITGIQLANKNGTTNLTHIGLFAYAKGATFENFSLANVKAASTSTSTAYMGTLAALVQDNVTVNNVTLSGINLSGANYVGGFFGGIVYSSATTASSITNSGVIGDTSDRDEAGNRIYSNSINGRYGAAGIVAHTSQYNTDMSGITVADAQITQEYSGTDNAYFDYGAAGISLAYSGNITANGTNRNRIEGCSIIGEIAAGVITRTYNSTAAKTYTLYTGRYTTTANPTIRATEVKISGTDVVATTVTGTHTTANTGTTMYNYSAVGGILARVDASYVEHEIIDCTLDSDTYVNAPFGAGGIIGCFESANNASATYYVAEYPVIIDSCTTFATVEITDSRVAIPTTFANRCCVGAGAILGYIGRTHSYAQTYIRNCTAGGVVRGNANIGGIVGAIWSTNTSFTFAGMDHHYAENCVVSAKLEVSDGAGGYVSAFKNNIKGVGVVVGHPAYSAYIQTNTTYGKYLHPSSGNSFSNANYPFYNIYFSDDTYRDEQFVRLYGIPSGTTEYSLNGFDYYTDYIYNLNRTSEFTMSKDSNNFALDFGNESYRIQLANPPVESEKFIYKLNSNFVTNMQYPFNVATFKLNKEVSESSATYQINTFDEIEDIREEDGIYEINDNVMHFEARANANANVITGDGTSEFILESITCPDPRVTIEVDDLEHGDFTISTVPLSTGVVSYLEFNYSNGTTLCMQLEIEIKPEDYWFRPQSNNADVNDILVFNAANLSYIRTMAAATSNIIQCYDVFWTVSDNNTIAAANAAVAGKKLSDVYSSAFIADLGTYKHPNPAWDGTDAKPRFVTFDEMFGTTDATRGNVLLSELVGDVTSTDFTVYGEDSGTAIYNRDEAFRGAYSVLTPLGSDEHYKIYGLALYSTHIDVTYPEHSGMFNKIGEGAVISDITFIDPDIRATRFVGADNYAGVLAGEITGAAISNITICKSSDIATAQVLSLRTVSPANTYVGAVAGLIGAGTTLDNITVDRLTVAGASTAGNRATQDKDIKNVFVGGVAGVSEGAISNVTLNNINVFVNRNEASARGYISYAGSVAGKASGTVENVTVSALITGCDVTINEDEINRFSFTCEANPSSEAGDRLGGVIGLATGSLTLNKITSSKLTVNAFDIAGGMIAEVLSDENTSVIITGCDIGNAVADENRAQITIGGSSNITGKTYSREFYNSVGGVVGYVNKVASLTIDDCDFVGYVGQCALEHKNCTAGGIIGLVDGNIASLDNIVIDASTVQGEVTGYRRGANDSAEKRMLGAAGGIIGKIYSFASKTFNSNDAMISNSVMSAKVNLYDNVNGSTVKADYKSLENQSDTNVGKIIGELRNDDEGDNFAYTAGTADDSDVRFTDYVNNVYISSYPQDIVAYGCNKFYSNPNNDPADTYVDVNTENRYMAPDAEAPEDVSSFMVDGSAVDITNPSHNYDTSTYSGVAIITFDEEQAATSASRHFRLAYDSLQFKEGKDAIKFNGNFNIYVENDSVDLNDVTVSSSDYQSSHRLTETVKLDSDGSTHSYNYYTGVITVNSNENVDIVGYISAGYSYGLEVGIQFVSMEIAGNGTEATPFEVAKPKHFKVVRALRGAFYKQVANIDFADPANNQYSAVTEGAMYANLNGIEPIGSSSAPFTGNYNGQGYVISNVYINRSDENNVGFFGYIGNGNNRAVLRNIHIELASELDIVDENSNVTTVAGGVTGKDGVGGLVGYAYNASITNCSVVDSFVMGQTMVGGLIGRTGNAQLDSCFTSTSSYSYSVPMYVGANAKNVGALIGYTSGTTGIGNSFTLGLASVGTTTKLGVAGGMVGYNSSGTLTITDSLVGATVSDYTGVSVNGNTVRGLTVGGSAGTVAADNVIVASTNVMSMRTVEGKTDYVNPIVGTDVSGDAISNIYVEIGASGALNGSEPYTAVVKTAEGLYNFNVSTDADVAGDAYTAAYVAVAVIPVEASEKEITDKELLINRGNPGFFYPVTLNHGGQYSFTSSVIDMSDTVTYPDGLDSQMYGVKTESGVNKNTDLLFIDEDGKTTVYSNTYPYDMSGAVETGAVLKDGTVHANGEVAYKGSMPYFTVSAPATVKGGLTVEVTRKVVYPVQFRSSELPIATARQLFAISNSAEATEESKFFDFYTLNGVENTPKRNYTVVADIDLGSVNFTPIIGYKGVFNGNGFTLDNLKIDMPGSNEVGLFRTLSDATVQNLTVGVDTISAKDNVGALVGAIIVENVSNTAYNASVKIENCHVVLSEGGEGIVATGRNAGGLVGATTRAIKDSGISGSSSSVKVSGYDVVGGLVGYSEQPISNSYATGEVFAKFTSGSAVTMVHPWIINGTQGIAGAGISTGAEHGVGGLVGVLRKSASNDMNVADASVSYCFGSGIVTVTDAAYTSGTSYGVGGLVGVNGAGTLIDTSFSSGNVYYCYGTGSLVSCDSAVVGVGGLVGVMYSELNDVYSSASIAADFGDVSSATAVGAGGVAGVAYAKLSFAYSSGATLGTTSTADYSQCNYGAGGVIGVLNCEDTCANLIFDLNLSITDAVVGKILNGSYEENNSGAKTTKFLTTDPKKDGGDGFMSKAFGYVQGAYPYLTNFFRNDVSLTIRINALLSVVALQLNDLDVSAANGDGISMALNIPTSFTYEATGTEDSNNAGNYTYSYSDRNNLVDAAQGVIDDVTNTLSIQRTQNEAQYVNFVISIDAKDGNTSDENGNVYADVATRLVSRLCAPMLGTQTHPYLVATQKDLEHVGMTAAELQTALNNAADPVNGSEYKMYTQWATPILENGTPTEGVVNFRLMGYLPLTEYSRTPIADLTDESYTLTHNGNVYNLDNKGISFDGNGYSIRNLSSRLFAKLDSNSVLKNMTFENVNFANTSLIGELAGAVEGVNIYGVASGSNTAGVANTVNEGGKIIGSLVNFDYTDSASTSNVAGVALTNNGEIRMSASVGNFSGNAVSGMGGMVVTNNGSIVDSFTIGNMQFSDANNLGGFVNANNGYIWNSYTRCNILISANPADRVIGGFVARNNSGATITNAYSSGMFTLAADTSPLNIFAAQSAGTLTDCMFDKQMSGSTFSGIYDMAERTLDIVNLTNHPSMVGDTAYTLANPAPDIDPSTDTYHNIYYPQLSTILATKNYEKQINDKGEEVKVETIDSRMYRVLRAYSFISSATALVGNDNYIDNLALGSSTALSYDSNNNDLWRKTSGTDLASATFFGTAGAGIKGRRIAAVAALPAGYDPAADNTTVISAINQVKDFYDIAIEDAQLDLFVEVTGAAHPNFAGGQGTTDVPFEISTPAHVVALSFYGTNPDNNFKVINDIDMSSAVWSSYIDNFKASLNGNGYVLSNVTIGAEGNDSLFGKIVGGKIDKLGVAGIDVTVDGSSGGMLANNVISGASITNTYVVGTLTTTGTKLTNVGGLVGEIDGSTIDGCVVSGKIESDASVTGGVVGSALDSSVINNILSTVYVDAAKAQEGTAAGIVGTAVDSAQITSCIFASDVKGDKTGNIVGNGTAGDSGCYYDNQMSSSADETDEADGRTTHYLTGGATAAELFGEDTTMAYIDGFAGYPVPAGMVSGSDNFLAGLKLASAKINLASGAGAGSLNSFTTITAPSGFGKLTFTGGTPAYLVNITDTQINTDTSELALGEVVNRQVTYSLGDGSKMFRFIDVFVGKTLKVTYVFDNLADDANSVLTAYSGMNNTSAVTALVSSDMHSGVLCSSMVIPYDVDAGAYVIRVGAELPSEFAVNSVTAEVRKNGATVGDKVGGSYIVNNGTYKIAIAGGSEIDCDEIVITIDVKDAPWGIHKYFNIF